MRTTISVRHCEISEAVRARAESVNQRLAHLSPHALDSTVVFDRSPEPEECSVEIRLHVRGGQVLVGAGRGPDHRTALDRAEEKLRRQLERNTTQYQAKTRRSESRRP